jgi:two-component system alkaline phosphatase synthesis response regulator PhoP
MEAPMYKIFVVDDDEQMLDLIEQILAQQGYEVATFSRPKALLSALNRGDVPHLFILDASLPEMDGIDLCRQLRLNPKTVNLPIVFITGNDSGYSAAETLSAGADDFIMKPFALRELVARLRAHLRRVELPDSDLPVVRIYPDMRMVSVDEREIELTQVEFELLRYMCRVPFKLHSIQDLLSNVWNYPSDAGDAALVRNHIRNLRRKLETTPERPSIIQSRHGRGYTVKARVEVTETFKALYPSDSLAMH